ncbi:thermosome subunit [Candidatus Marsarchaeota G2 archaeon ECH_B_SAG-G16]|jgi:thermosome subunit|uniref:Thermosome subunit n=5 Tax=Candidatus Marsarchaeota TaxID=1978152 RepID=A0A2R6ADZ3_9ARCH|nr:MAG: thermosome subunit [Candidatus Marsarchaeota G1 archaeon OSP_D]PSN89674.1 MAG: thermosome subunit [Candidatus Marsarchaeota G1 archaeon OSP_C]PSO04281.1 MAG: thermosome subunit [Candidatus Marsarchaeota G2 archaeon ECH_B_SAG-G16]
MASQGIPVLILKEGSRRTTGREALRTNILAAAAIAEALRSSLGPRGLDKMLIDSFGDVTITNDGATIVKDMEVEQPAAKMLVEVAKAQDAEVGDGTTTAVVLAGELLTKANMLLEDNVHPSIIIEGYRKAASQASKLLNEVARKVDAQNTEALKEIAKTALSSKIVSSGAALDKLAELSVKAVLQVQEKQDDQLKIDLDNVKIEKRKGESLLDTELIMGVVIDKEVVHPGMPKRVENAKIALLDTPLEIEKTEITAKIQISSPEQMKAFLDQETQILREMVEKLAKVGANVVICQKGIDDVAQHFLAKKGILAVRRAKRSDMEKLARATGARIVTNIDDLTPQDLGEAQLVEERRVANEKMVFVEGCKNPRAVTILVRGSGEMVLDEIERSLNDSLNVVRNVVLDPKIVPGGGATETYLAVKLKEFANTVGGKEQLAVQQFAEALLVVPEVLAETAGLDTVETLAELKAKHESGKTSYGIDAVSAKITDMFEAGVIEPLRVKQQILKSATEAALMILKIDDVIAASPPKPEKKGEGKEGGKEGGFEGGGMSGLD